MNKVQPVTVIGAGLAGCEAAWQVALRDVPVTLIEMKPARMSPAHKSADFCELVCSNSLRTADLTGAPGLLKEEMRRLSSLVVACADETRIPAGGALAVDRERFSALVTKRITAHPLISVCHEEAACIPETGFVIVATGPLTDGALSESIRAFFGDRDYLHFYDAAAPVVSADSVDMNHAFAASRYNKGEGDGDYINCPMTEEEYERFIAALVTAEEAPVHGFEDKKVFEGCMPIEVMARRGADTVRYGPLKPVGLIDPKTGKEPHAVVQLRRDNAEGSLYNLVGFQTHLKFPEQKRVFSMIPALHDAEYVRYGVMHRNSYIDSPRLLNRYYQAKHAPRVMFAGQLSGVEGYVESAASGLCAGMNMARMVLGKPMIDLPDETAIGALPLYISDRMIERFQPMNINFGLLPPLSYRVKGKREKNRAISERALVTLDKVLKEIDE